MILILVLSGPLFPADIAEFAGAQEPQLSLGFCLGLSVL
jgi:hypothetical protein